MEVVQQTLQRHLPLWRQPGFRLVEQVKQALTRVHPGGQQG
jgi:hypothetical protein